MAIRNGVPVDRQGVVVPITTTETMRNMYQLAFGVSKTRHGTRRGMQWLPSCYVLHHIEEDGGRGAAIERLETIAITASWLYHIMYPERHARPNRNV